MSRFRQRDRRRPAIGSRGGTIPGIWVPSDPDRESAANITINGRQLGADGGDPFESIELFAEGARVDLSGIWLRQGADIRPCTALDCPDDVTIRLTFGAASSAAGVLLIAPFRPGLVAQSGAVCGGCVLPVLAE